MQEEEEEEEEEEKMGFQFEKRREWGGKEWSTRQRLMLWFV